MHHRGTKGGGGGRGRGGDLGRCRRVRGQRNVTICFWAGRDAECAQCDLCAFACCAECWPLCLDIVSARLTRRKYYNGLFFYGILPFFREYAPFFKWPVTNQ